MILLSFFNIKSKAANSGKEARLSGEETVKRYVLLILGLFFAGVGVAFTKKGELGVSPVSSAANVMSCKYDFLSLGGWLIIWNCILIVGQILILRKNWKQSRNRLKRCRLNWLRRISVLLSWMMLLLA